MTRLLDYLITRVIQSSSHLIILFLLTACAPHVQPFHPQPDQQPQLAAGIFHTADDAALPYRHWLPKDKPEAIIIAVHGFNDYSHGFETTGTFFQKHRIAVYAYDQRGFGQSPDTGIWAGEENLTHDLAQFVKQIEKRYPKTPVYIMGESMGGAVVINAVSDPAFPKVQGVILSAPALWGADTMNPIFRGTLWFGAHTIPYWTLTGQDLHILASDNIPMLQALGADPLVIKKTRIDAIYGLVELMDEAYAKVPAIKTPTLLLYGAHDQVIPPAPIESARKRFEEPITYVYYPNGYHMLERDLEGELVLQDILNWIEHPAASLPPETENKSQ